MRNIRGYHTFDPRQGAFNTHHMLEILQSIVFIYIYLCSWGVSFVTNKTLLTDNILKPYTGQAP